jgi:hypothetical protein
VLRGESGSALSSRGEISDQEAPRSAGLILAGLPSTALVADLAQDVVEIASGA